MINLIEFADLVNQELRITYHPNQNRRFSCYFFSGEIRKGIAMLLSECGNGHTPQEAMDEYAKKISGKTIIFHAMSESLRKEYHVPLLKEDA